MDLNLSCTFFFQAVQDLPSALQLLAVFYLVYSRVLESSCREYSARDNGHKWPHVSTSLPDFASHVYPSPRFCSTTCHDTTTSHHFLDSWIAIDAYTYYIFRFIFTIDPHSWLNYDVDMSITPLLTSLQCARRWLRIRPVASDYRSRSSRVQT